MRAQAKYVARLRQALQAGEARRRVLLLTSMDTGHFGDLDADAAEGAFLCQEML